MPRFKTRPCLTAAATVLSILAACQPIRAEPFNALVSPMVDQSIFQTGQVERFHRAIKDWSAVCDEVKALNRRFCSLRSSVVADSGGRPVFADVSTSDNGQPAALLHLPSGISLGLGVAVSVLDSRPSAKPRKVAPRPRAATDVKVAICGDRECLAAWPLQPGEVAGLINGGDIALSYCTVRATPSEFRPSLASASCEHRYTAIIPGSGFKDVVTASVQ